MDCSQLITFLYYDISFYINDYIIRSTTLTVTGTEQRVYGTLVGGCIIDLHRFALVSGSTTQSPIEASSVVYADTTPYKQCGYKYDGFLTLFLSISGSTVYAAVEVRICKNDAKRIVIETYGEVAKTVTGGMGLWFNKGNDTTPDWVKLNSTTSGVIMPYATTSYTFKESKRNGSITIDCCKKCPSCGCKNCDIANRFRIITTTFTIIPIKSCCEYVNITQSDSTSTGSTSTHYGYNHLGDQSVIFTNIIIEYKLTCDTVNIWVYSKETNMVYSKVEYYDDSGIWNVIAEGFKEDIGVYP